MTKNDGSWLLMDEMDWFAGKLTGTPCISWEIYIYGFRVGFSL